MSKWGTMLFLCLLFLIACSSSPGSSFHIEWKCAFMGERWCFILFLSQLVCHHFLNSRVSKLNPLVKYHLTPVFINKVLLEYRHTHSFMYREWQGGVFVAETTGAAGLNTQTSGPLQQKFADLCSSPGKELKVKVAEVIVYRNISTAAAIVSFCREINFWDLFLYVCWI